MQSRMVRHARQRAFTLLELVIVIVILAILAGLAVPRYLKTVQRSRATECLQVLRQLSDAANRLYARNNQSYSAPTALSLNSIDFDPTDVGGAANWTYAVSNVGANTFTWTATANDGSGTITLNQAGTVAGTGSYVGI